MAIITEIRRKLPLFPRRANEQPPNEHGKIHHLSIEDIIPNRSQPRAAFNQNAIIRLSESIKRYGILQPLTVRRVILPVIEDGDPTPTTPVYELVAGERRLRAAKIAGLETVPCLIINTDDATSAELAIIENLLRENLNMFEQAEAFARLIREFHLTQEEAARRVSMSQSAVANKLRILRLSREEREKILSAGLTERHARALLKLNDRALREDVLAQIVEKKMNVSASEAYIDRILTEISRFEYKNSKKECSVTSQDPFSATDPSPKASPPESVEQPAFAQQPDAVSEVVSDEDTAHHTQEQPPTQAFSEDEALPDAIAAVISRRQTRFKGCIKDLQLFYNSVHNAVRILQSAGISGEIAKSEREDQVKVTITLTRTVGA